MSTELLSFFVDCAVRATLLLGFAGGMTAAMRRASASMRHRVWACAIIAAALVPLTLVTLPRWRLPSAVVMPQLRSGITPAAPDGGSSDAANPSRVARPQRNAAPDRTVDSPRLPLIQVTTGVDYARIAAIAWAAGTAAVLLCLVASILSACRLRRAATRLDGPWIHEAQALAGDLKIRTSIVLAGSSAAPVPIVCGLWRPVIVLPQAARQWSPERLRVVVLHELAHIKRRDYLMQPLAYAVCAVYWFNPVTWLAARALRTECERACDDVVLATGTKGSDYAGHLLEIARSMQLRRLSLPAALSIARRSQLEQRLIAVLDPSICRSSGVRARCAVMAAVLLISIPASAIQLIPDSADRASTVASEAALPSSAEERPATFTAMQREPVSRDAVPTIGARAESSSLTARPTTQASDFQWSGNLAQGETLEVRGVAGQIRTSTSTDGVIHVYARISDPGRIRVDVLQREAGITLCTVASMPRGERNECQPGHRDATAQSSHGRVDFVVQVPAGVRFAGSMIDGDIVLNDLRSDVDVATISGNIALNVSRSHGADFFANLISGAIDSDVPLHDSTPPLPSGDRVTRARAPRIVRATIGNGGPALRATTINGNIRLRQR
jgi:beta-lactamase regulating signal transducer with metallopeptidase domain